MESSDLTMAGRLRQCVKLPGSPGATTLRSPHILRYHGRGCRMDSERPSTDPVAAMESSLIAEYLQTRGHTLESLHHLPETEAKALMTAASLHASMRLTEVESRAHFVEAIKGDADFAGKG